MTFQDILTILTAFIETSFFAGIYLGWPSLKYVLIKEGFFSDQCNSRNEISTAYETATTPEGGNGQICNEAQASFNLVFTVANFLAYATSLPLGYIFDRYGT